MPPDLAHCLPTVGSNDHTEDLFAAAFRAAAIGMAIVGLDGRWLTVNDSICRIVGYSREELLETTFQKITHPDDLHLDLAQAERLLRGEIASYDLEKRYLHKDGQVVWILLSATLVRTAAGQPRFFIAQVQNITAEKQLRSEAQSFFETSADMLAITGTTGTLELVNAAWTRTLGWTREELTTMPFIDFIHPDDRQRTLDEAAAVYAGHPTAGFTNRYRAKSGAWHWLEWSSQPTSKGRLYCVVRDVTRERTVSMALEASEARFRTLAEGSVQGIVVMGESGGHEPLYVNAAAARIFGFSSVMEMVQLESLASLLAPELTMPPPSLSLSILPRGSSSAGGRTRMRRQDGSLVYVDVLRTEIEWDGRIAVQLTLVDVSEETRLERSLLRSADIQRVIANHLPNGAVFLFDRDLRYLLADGSALYDAIGLPRGAMEGKTVHDFVSEAKRKEVVGAYEDAIAGLETRLVLERNGRTFDVVVVPIRDDLGAVVAGMALAYDVTERRREADELRSARAQLAAHAELLRDMSNADSLTGVLNRRGFLAASRERLDAARATSPEHLLLFVDLDGMKPINDELGHEAGDEALREAAELLVGASREGDVVARLGGDEFAILATSAGRARSLQQRIELAVATANARPCRRFAIAMSIGAVAFTPSDSRSIEDLIAEADRRMYEQKKSRRSNVATSGTLGLRATSGLPSRHLSGAPAGR